MTMTIEQVGDVYLIKDDAAYVGGKFETSEAAQAAINSLPAYLFETVWISVIGDGRNVITEDDITSFISDGS